MAETLLFGVAESFIGKLTSRAVEEASRALGVYDDLREMSNTVSFIKAVLLDAEQKQQQNHELREWLRQIKRVFSDAENVIDDFECEALGKQVVNTSGNIKRKVRRFFSSSNPLVYRLRMAHEIKAIKERLDKVAADRRKFGLQTNDSDNRVVHRRELTHSHVNDSEVIGREHDKQNIVQLLLQDGDDDKGGDTSLSVIPIVGIGGLGKTTLAKWVFNDKSIVEYFPLKMWVCVSDDFDLKHVLVKILNSATETDSTPNPIHQENFKNFDIQQLQRHVRNTLVGQKFLLVLDDIWNEDRVKWEGLRGLIEVGAEGSKVLVTTRSHIVANVMGTHSSYNLQGLSAEDSLSVFVRWAFKEGEEKKHPELMEIGKDIVQKCGGLPLALRTLGSSLFLKLDIQEWKFLRDNGIWNLPQKEHDILPAIKLSYDQLPSYLKPCFASFSLFEKDFYFDSLYVMVLWQALGYLPSPKKGENFEDIGNRFLRELWSRSFLQDFIDYGSICAFKLHDLVHDLALYVARDEFQLLNSQGENISENVLHLSFIKNDLLGQSQIPTGLRTILFPNKANNEAFMNILMSRCKYLRVLQLLDSRHESLPRSIGKLKHLRYLNLEFNEELKRLPDSVCKLQNLQTLNLAGCIELQTLPNGIGNLISLQKLVITTKQSDFPEKEIAKLNSLEFLCVYYCNNFESLFDGIQLHNVKFLIIYCCGNLKSLSLHAFPNLVSLVINGCKKLNFSMGHDNQIPKLRLKLLYVGSLPQLVTFPQWLQGCANTIQSLEIASCENIVELPNWMSTLICLNLISILSCPNLLLLPDDLLRLPNLEYIKIEDCQELCRRYQPRVGQDWPKISHIKQVIIESSKPKKSGVIHRYHSQNLKGFCYILCDLVSIPSSKARVNNGCISNLLTDLDGNLFAC